MILKIPPSTQAIIFDLGGVILNIDYTRTIEEFGKLGITDFQHFFSKQVQKNFFDEYEKGLISSAHFIEKVKTFLPPSISESEIKKAWNAMLLDLPTERLELLEKLRKKYKLFLLSNTNEIHITEFNNYLQNQFSFTDLSPYFDKMYLSYQLGMRKPDTEIFRYVLNQNNLKSEEVVFIDDSPQHIESSKRLGINAFHLQDPNTILDITYW